MKLHSRTYTAYSIGCGVAWSGILAVAAAEAGEDTRRALELVLAWMGRRVAFGRHRPGPVYPPPGSRQPAGAAP